MHLLLGHLLRFAVPIGIVIALAELAVGMGALLGLWTRVAAAGGIFLSLTLFLTVSFHSSPYYTGADIVFVFAWVPLLAGGLGWRAVPRRGDRRQGGGREKERAADRGADPLRAGAAGLRQLRGRYVCRTGRTALRRPSAARFWSTSAAACGAGARRSGPTDPGPRRDRSRRLRSHRGGCRRGRRRARTGRRRCAKPRGSGYVRSLYERSERWGWDHHDDCGASGRADHDDDHRPGAAGKRIGLASQVPVGGAATFTDPATGDPGLVLQLTKDQFVAYDAICPHAGCTVGYAPGAKLIVCPCHGSEFDPTTGAVVSPPASRGLTPIPVAVSADGSLLGRRLNAGRPADRPTGRLAAHVAPQVSAGVALFECPP